MSETWPELLQERLNTANWQEIPVDTNIRTNPETGPVKVRRRFTNPEVVMTCQIWIHTINEYNQLKLFTEVTLKSRTLGFNYNHPITGELKLYRVEEPEKITPLGGNSFRVDMVWRELHA